MRFPSAVFLSLLGLAGCSHEHRILEDGCELGEEREIATLIGPAPHDIVLLGADGGGPTHVAWSERSGLFVRALAPDDAPVARLGPACDAGLASQGTLLACARRGDDAKAQLGHVTVVDVTTGETVEQVSGVGPDSYGVSVAVAGEARALAWNDSRGTTSLVRLRRGETDPQRISREGVRAGRPAVRFERADEGPRLVLAWPETWVGAEGVEGVIRAQRGERTSDLETLTYDAAHPSIALDDDGQAVVVFRDRRPARTRPRLFLRRLGRTDEAHDGVHANADGESIVVPCGGALVVVAPRTHSRTERLVAVRRHDLATLEGSGPEHQIYMHGAAFEHADARCEGGDVLIAVASHQTIERPHGTVSTVRFTCPDPDAVER
ncbi:MAG: hypothetical protein J0L92_23720 [Deltaproteobacteria bacterium]|nr:hypothetical protein [Deltaproteobacteria bacterium]